MAVAEFASSDKAQLPGCLWAAWCSTCGKPAHPPQWVSAHPPQWVLAPTAHLHKKEALQTLVKPVACRVGPWTATNCTACYKGACLAPQACNPPTKRRQLLAPNPCDALANTKQCYLYGLESTTQYE